MAYTTNSAQQPLARSLACVLALATTLALAPGDTLADVRDGLIAEYRLMSQRGVSRRTPVAITCTGG